MNYHLGAPHMPVQNAQPAGLNGLNVPEYTCHDLPISNGTTQNMLGPVVVYGVNRVLYHREENSQTNSWPAYRTCAEALAISHDDPQLEAQYIPEAQQIVSNNAMLHAPVPLSGQQPLPFSGALHYNYPELESQALSAEESSFSALQGYHPPQLTMASDTTTTSSASDAHYPQDTGLNGLPTDYHQNEVPTRTFPTPSELLIELTNGNSAGRGAVHCDSNRNSGGDPSRRSRRRLVSRNLGLIPGDSVARETISSHEKKRQYLECLEYYVMFLHQQLNLVGANPVPLERVQQYRGLNNRSIRTLLVHMEHVTEKLNMRILREEQRFVDLRDAVSRQDVVTDQTLQNQKVHNGGM